jgi:ribosomal protein S4
MKIQKKSKFSKNKNYYEKKQSLKNIKNIIKQISVIKYLINSLENIIFKKFCENFLSIKLFNFGLTKNPLDLYKKKLKYRNFLNRKIIVIILKKNLVKTYKKGLRLIKSGKIFIDVSPVLNPNILLSREMENKLSIQN